MTNTYDTSNEPLGSPAVKVLYNNASNLDDAVNSDADTWIDRPPFGRVRRTWRGMENAFDHFMEESEDKFAALLQRSGFELPPLVYVDGSPLQVDRSSQVIERSGNLYSVKLPSSFPVNLSGNWAADEPLLVLRTDQAIRSDLAAPTGSTLVGVVLPDTSSGTVQEYFDFLRIAALPFSTVADLAAAYVGPQTLAVRTVAAVAGGSGGQLFTRYAGAEAADGYWIVQSADGGKWRGTETPTPKHFGAIDGTDITAGLQRWATYVASHDQPACWDATGFVTAKVTATVGVGSTSYSRYISGKLRLTDTTVSPSVPIECLIEFNDFVQSKFGDGEYIGRQVFAQRNVDNAFRFSGCKYMSAGNFYIWGCRRFGIDLGYYTTEFKFQAANTLYCGSNNYQRYPFDYASTFRYGTGTGQRSAIQNTGGTLDPALRPGDGFLVNNHYYHVREVDHVGGNFRIFPCLTAIDAASLASDPINNAFVVIGGGLHHGGGDTNAGYIVRFSGLVNGHDIQADELYPVSVGKFGTQLSAVGLRLGVDFTNAYRGGSIADAYVEACRIFIVELASGGESPYQVMQLGQFTPAVGVEHPGLTDESTFVTDPLSSRAYVLTPEPMSTVAVYGDPAPTATTAGGNTPVTTIVVDTGIGHSVKLSLDKMATDAHRRFALQLNIVSATGGAPGSVTFTADPGVTVMSSASYVKNLTTSVILLAIFHNNNWLVVQSGSFSV